MDAKKKIKKMGQKVPLLSERYKRIELEKHILLQHEDITGLHEAVTRLEYRNNLWEKEVRELRGEAKSLNIVWPVKKEDIVAADWQKSSFQKDHHIANPPFVINWVVPPMDAVSGGHSDIFRTIKYLETQGHTCRIYFYDPRGLYSLEGIKETMKKYPKTEAELFYTTDNMADCDAVFATNWFSAYPVFNWKTNAKKYYYVQDFEPYFEPVGSYSTLAENTYRFGLRGITLGQWLSEKLSKEYGMKCDFFELGVDNNEYKLTNTKPRKKILFYARPVTPRRGFELGVLALEIFHKQHPGYEINFLGWDISPYEIPFPYINNGILKTQELNNLYNECAAGLVLSFTNMSLLPLEMLASGCIPVVNDAEHTRKVGYAEKLVYASPHPQAFADALHRIVTNKEAVMLAQSAADYATKFQWDNSNKVIEQLLIKELT